MKNIHFLGFILWLLASFFGFRLAKFLFFWYNDIGLIYKIIMLFVTTIIILIGFYKIILAFLLLVNKNHVNFNIISSIFSVIGLFGLVGSYLFFGFEFDKEKNSLFDDSLSYSFGFLLVIILINGFVLFPKSLTKYKN